ncbi:MAG: anthrone oxygenase family protein [Blastocatellia bacterium]
MNKLILVLTIVTALGSGLIAGAFFAFSNFVMKALGRIPSAEGMHAMQSINVVVINPVFLGVFMGSAVLCVVMVIFSVFRWQDAGSAYLLVGAVLYFAGTFLVTLFVNVPLNNALAVSDPASSVGQDMWANYLANWTFWNHVRTVAALASTASLIAALTYLGR